MLDPAIQAFLDERKALWLKKKITIRSSDEEKATIEREATELFSLASWLPDAAKRAKQLSMVSHPGKFTHPSAKTSSIIAKAERKADGYLRTGNVAVELDVFGNAAAMDVHKLLSLVLKDGQSVLQHLENKSATIMQQFTLPNTPYETLANELLAMKQTDTTQMQTSGYLKQVYFPVNTLTGEYHLLSTLTCSGMLYQLKERLNQRRFSKETKAAREAKKKAEAYSGGYSDITDLVAMGFGGTKPQNISVLNSKNGGVANLLYSMPPPLEKKRFSPPAYDFFINTLNPYYFTDFFNDFHQKRTSNQTHVYARRAVEQAIKQILYETIHYAWQVRRLDAGWSQKVRHQNLPHYQKVWLDQHYQAERKEDTQWLNKVKTEMAHWFMDTYQALFKHEAIQGDDELLLQLKNKVAECEEALK